MKVKANGISINYQVDGPERAPPASQGRHQIRADELRAFDAQAPRSRM